jgi:ABC-type sugar transport system ATPase subunit
MDIYINNITKKFGNVTAVDKLSLHIKSGEFVAFLGPSGCGKTTTLLMIAGIYKPNGGSIFFGEKDVTYLPPKDRNIGMVFQSYALYPHMNVYENITFSMKLKKESENVKRKEAQKIADMLGIGHLLERKPGELSGGQQQRVALGRALIKKPELLLFDEPLSNLDARLRISMRSEIKRIQKELGITCIYVTHDQIEAMTMADRVAVIKDGQLQAYVPPMRLHENPSTLFIGQFVGNPPMNTWNSQVKGIGGLPHVEMCDGTFLEVSKNYNNLKKGSLVAGIRAEDIELVDKNTKGAASAIVNIIEPLGRDNLLDCQCGNKTIEILSDPHLKIKAGDKIFFSITKDAWQFFDKESGKSLLWNL